MRASASEPAGGDKAGVRASASEPAGGDKNGRDATSHAGPRPVAAADSVAALARLVLNFRLVTVLLSVLYSGFGDASTALLPVVILVAGVASSVPVMLWARIGPVLVRHPAILFADVVLALGVLLLTGVQGPFVYYTLASAFLAGVLYDVLGGLLLSGVLLLGYFLVVEVHRPLTGLEPDFHVLVALPSLFVLSALGAVAVRRLLQRQSLMQADRVVAEATAARLAERERLAREMHDALGKTVHGIALSAAVLPDWVRERPAEASARARQVTDAAQRAAAEARELISDLRSDRLDEPLEQAAERFLDTWAGASGLTVRRCLQPVRGPGPSARYELFCVLKELLRNVERHADAMTVKVILRQPGARVELCVEDNGRGFSESPEIAAFAGEGHFGLLGCRERVERVGGRISLGAAERGGARVTVTLPSDARVGLAGEALGPVQASAPARGAA